MERRARHEATDERHRHERRDDAQVERAHDDLDDAGNEGDGARHADLVRFKVWHVHSRSFRRVRGEHPVGVDAVRLGEPQRLAIDNVRDEQTDDGHRSEGDVTRRTEQEVEQHREDGAVQPVDCGEGCEDRETHPLRDVDDPDADPGDDVRHQPLLPLVVGHDVDHRQSIQQLLFPTLLTARTHRLGRAAQVEGCLRGLVVVTDSVELLLRVDLAVDLDHVGRRPFLLLHHWFFFLDL